ncbi:MAG: hypothetical protein HYR72_23980 [Deltaproteobacteria bacterium]|nr:hypothetical protein [Deltaproteobacteria bacterium]
MALATCALPVAADVPNLLNYQGRLTDPAGAPKNGTFTMQFAVYDAESAGNQLPIGSAWAETQTVTVTNGVFNVLLGSVTALPANVFTGGPSDAAGPLRFLQVTVDGEALSPRRRIVSAAYAMSGGANGLIYRTTADQAVVSSTALTTCMTGTVPGGTLGSDKIIHVVAIFDRFGLSNSKRLTLVLNYGTSSLDIDIANASGGTIGGSGSGSLRVEAFIVASGATNAQEMSINVVATPKTADLVSFDTNIAANLTATGNRANSATENSTVDKTLTLTAQLNNQSVNDLFTFSHGFVERIN